jgi:hypothetical protein
VPSQLLQNRPDIRRAERELVAAGLDVFVARANFYPQLILTGGVGLQAFDISYLFVPQAVVGNIAAGFIGPLVNRRAIRAEYLASNARQLQAIYDYQRTILDAFTEVVNRMTMVQNYSDSVAIKKQQMASLESAVDVANSLFQFARVEYLDVLTAQRDLRDARTALIDTKERQLIALVRAYQALGGGALLSNADRDELLHPIPHTYQPLTNTDFRGLSWHHFGAGKYFRALGASLQGIVPYHDNPHVREKLFTQPANQPAQAPLTGVPAPAQPGSGTAPAADSAPVPALPSLPPPALGPGPFRPSAPDDTGGVK